jgi:hypothetical protein
MFDHLKPRLQPGARIIIRSCAVAQEDKGKKFIQDLADLTGATVIAFDGDYGVTPGGNEFIADPGETYPKCGHDYGRPLIDPSKNESPATPPPSQTGYFPGQYGLKW